jgi:hypothetical protein
VSRRHLTHVAATVFDGAAFGPPLAVTLAALLAALSAMGSAFLADASPELPC